MLKLSGPEKSDYLNFVIKDDSTGRWWVCQAEASSVVQTCTASAPRWECSINQKHASTTPAILKKIDFTAPFGNAASIEM